LIDYLKISTTDFDHESLLRHPLLNFSGWTEMETSELKPNKYGNKKYVSYLHNLKIVVYENVTGKFTLCILGSIHKFHNNGVHNHNDFCYNDLKITIDRLSEILLFNPKTCKISNIEIGVNIPSKVSSTKVLKGLLMHKGKRFKSYSFDNANYHQVIHENYYIKVYDKAKQYRAKGHILDNDIIRIELKYKRMSDLIVLLNSQGIINRNHIVLDDLKNIEVLKAFGILLIKKWNEILFYDYTISKKDLSKPQRRKLDVWQNINQWESFSKQKKSKQKKLLDDVIKQHSKQIQLQVSNLIQEKLETLLPKGLPINHFNKPQKNDQLTTSITDGMEEERLPINSIYKEVNGNSFEDCFSAENPEKIRSNYEAWINDPREILF